MAEFFVGRPIVAMVIAIIIVIVGVVSMSTLPGAQYPLVSRVSDVEGEIERLVQAANERDVRVYPVASGGLGGGVSAAMTMLASETGGRWIENTNDLGVAFERVAEDSSCFYRVGFRMRSRFRGKADTVVVKISGEGSYRLRHRRTIYDATREERNRDRIQAAMLDPIHATALPVLLSATPLLQHGDPNYLLSIQG